MNASRIRNFLRTLLMSAALLVSAACAGTKSYSTGLRSGVAPNFFVAMKQVALARNLEISERDGALDLRTSDGDWIHYSVEHDQVTVVVVPDTGGKSDGGIAKRQAELKTLSDQLVAEARQNAEANRSFE